MLRPSPELQKKLDIFETIDPTEIKAIKHEKRRMLARKLSTKALTTLLVLGVPVSAYAQNVRQNQELQSESSISVVPYAGPLNKENDHNAIVFTDGFGTNNADILTKYLGPSIQQVEDGQMWSVDQNNAILSPEAIASQILSLVDQRGITSLSLVGQSAGGSVTMEVQEDIRKQSSIPIRSIFFAATPDGLDGLQPEQQKNIGLIKLISKFPGAAYSDPLRSIGELLLRSDAYTSGSLPENIGNFFSTVDNVNTALKDNTLPGSWLMIDQALAIENADITGRNQTIGKLPADQLKPTEVYIGMLSDPIVNEKKSSLRIGASADAAHIPYFYYQIHDGIHGQPQFSVESYKKVLAGAKDEIQASIQTQLSIASLHRVTSYMPHPIESPKQ
jgi:pimeloyl-ACP methyl ester carboxylesterase